MNPEALSECLYDWLGCNREEGSVIAIDGKTIRGSRSESHKVYHVVSAFVAEKQLVLGELVTEEKSNEITAVPELLDSLNIESSIITADAMSCQKEIVKKIREGGADYVIGLKGNQPNLLEDVSFYFEHFERELPCFVTRAKDHGKIERREYRLERFVLAAVATRLRWPAGRWYGHRNYNKRWKNHHRHTVFPVFCNECRTVCLHST